MRIRSVKLLNIRSYTSETILFPEGSVLLSGDIGAGKSTILLAIEFALFGVLRGAVDGAALLRQGKTAGYVELCLDLDGKEIIIHRPLRRNKHSIAQAAGYLIQDGIRTDCTPVELKGRMLELLGYPARLLGKSKSLIYRYTVYTPQEEMKAILFEDASARLDTLRRVFQIESYRFVRDNTAVILRALRESLSVLSARTEQLPQKKQQKDVQLKSVAGSVSSLERLGPMISAQGEKVKAQKNLVASYEQQRAQAISLKSEIAIATATIHEKENAMNKQRAELAIAERDIRSIQLMLASSEDLPQKFAAHFASLNAAINKLRSESENATQISKDMADTEAKLAAIAGDLSRAEGKRLHPQRLEKDVLEADACPFCLQQIQDPHKNSIREMMQKELAECNRIIREKASEKEIASQRLSHLKAVLEGLQQKDRRLAELSSAASHYSPFAQGLSLPENALPNEDHGPLQVLSRKIEERSRRSSMLSEKQSLCQRSAESLSASAAELSTTKERLPALLKQMEPFASLDDLHSAAREKLERIQKEAQDLLLRQAALLRDVQHATDNLAVIDADISKMEEASKELTAARGMSNWLDGSFAELMEVMERHVLLRVHGQFSELFQRWYGILMEDEAMSARLDDAFTPIIEINGYEVAMENLSGGEKTSCALAYRLALNKVINDLISTVKTKDLLILDEPTDGFSAQQLEKVREVLEQLNLPQIIIVSHEQKIESFVSNVLHVVKEEQVSHVVG